MKVGIDPSTWSRYLSGDLLPSVQKVCRIKQALEISSEQMDKLAGDYLRAAEEFYRENRKGPEPEIEKSVSSPKVSRKRA